MNAKLATKELGRLSPEEAKNTHKTPISIILDDIRSHHNVGAIFRSCDAFLIEKIYLCGITPRPPHRDIHKTALGATETVEWEYHPHAQELLKNLKHSSQLIAVEQTQKSMALNDYDPDFSKGKKIALIFGNEVYGVSQELILLSDLSLEIPQFGSKHSLNVSVCAGISIWQIFCKWQKQSLICTFQE